MSDDDLKDAKIFNGEIVDEEAQSAKEMISQSHVPMRQSRTEHHTAMTVQKPRVLSKVCANVLEEAKIAGKSFYYRFPVGGKTVIGGTVGLAMCIAREWTNAVLEINERETPTHWIFEVRFVDLEKGMTFPRTFRQPKPTVIPGGFDKNDEQRARYRSNQYQKGQSTAIRNAILKCMPEWIIDKAIDVAMDAEKKGITKMGLEVARAEMVNIFKSFGVSPERIEALFKRSIDDLTVDDIEALRNYYDQLRKNLTTVDSIFPVLVPNGEKSSKSPDSKAKGTNKKAGDASKGKKEKASIKDKLIARIAELESQGKKKRINEVLNAYGKDPGEYSVTDFADEEARIILIALSGDNQEDIPK
jgi:hypothetical protein